MEDHLVEWVDQANEKHIAINDCVLKAATEQLMVVLLKIPSHIKYEDYTDFTISNSWLSNVKQRHGLSRQKMRGDGAEVDPESLPLIVKNWFTVVDLDYACEGQWLSCYVQD